MWCSLCLGQQGAELPSDTDLQYDANGLSVAVKQGGRGRSWGLSQRGHTEQNGLHHQSSGHTQSTKHIHCQTTRWQQFEGAVCMNFSWIFKN